MTTPHFLEYLCPKANIRTNDTTTLVTNVTALPLSSLILDDRPGFVRNCNQDHGSSIRPFLTSP
eukprot:CAMPEP_0202487462 /NCGR_PEP_ID=MMETSP1361-20130828/5763_1 /ASSEMBLY_ACC=CAM_ASM_000849 /TAXON_ID=210615 /ORGANISM="Staurosira complex sp., Strain CCMP2646" /LENGTH=63 /DNA_ID=CAMNT_0049116835 /DNA_START=59 /DNA_END=246 /DNA_ORIENTATION=+